MKTTKNKHLEHLKELARKYDEEKEKKYEEVGYTIKEINPFPNKQEDK